VPRPLFDDIVHERSRLQICGLLASVVEADFATVRGELDLSESALSKHLKTLEAAGYLTVSKRSDRGRTRTVVGLTEAGRHAFCGHVAALQRLAGVASVRGRARARRVLIEGSATRS
jgi:DNA-binding MarR family transcriptional regulator